MHRHNNAAVSAILQHLHPNFGIVVILLIVNNVAHVNKLYFFLFIAVLKNFKGHNRIISTSICSVDYRVTTSELILKLIVLT